MSLVTPNSASIKLRWVVGAGVAPPMGVAPTRVCASPPAPPLVVTALDLVAVLPSPAVDASVAPVAVEDGTVVEEEEVRAEVVEPEVED